MDSVTAAEIAKLETMTVSKLVERFESLVGEKCRSRNKRYLVRRIAWRLQANAEGGLSERALKRAAELGNFAGVFRDGFLPPAVGDGTQQRNQGGGRGEDHPLIDTALDQAGVDLQGGGKE